MEKKEGKKKETGKAFVPSFDISFQIAYAINKIQGHEQGSGGHEGLLRNFERVQPEFLKLAVSTLRLTNVLQYSFYFFFFFSFPLLFFVALVQIIKKITRKSHVRNVINRV